MAFAGSPPVSLSTARNMLRLMSLRGAPVRNDWMVIRLTEAARATWVSGTLPRRSRARACLVSLLATLSMPGLTGSAGSLCFVKFLWAVSAFLLVRLSGCF